MCGYHYSPGDFKEKFPRNFRFTVTVPRTFIAELPAELQGGVPQLEVSVVAQDPVDPPRAEALVASVSEKGEDVK
jgi:hypothetical protein